MIGDLKAEDFSSWKHHPVSKLFFKFLSDKREFIKSAALEQWVNGSDSFSDCNQTVRGQIIELQEVIETPFEAIVEFYQERENEAETIVNPQD